jgi:prepilin-type N-terminal cleavage/methylation domain-containing protein
VTRSEGRRAVSSRLGARAALFNPQPAIRNSQSTRSSFLAPRPSPRGLTLVELLIVILIIGILAGLILGVAAVAAETAREAQTRHTVARLHNLLMEHYNTYKSRRVRLRPQVETAINGLNRTSSERGQLLAEARLYALREMMLLEVPDRWSDVLLREVPTSPTGFPDARLPVYLDSAGSAASRNLGLADVYLRRYDQMTRAHNAFTGVTNTADEIMANQGAECLYMIITLATGDGEARRLFGESSVGDTDGDGAPEFLDGWDHPISFLRWAPGFDSQIQINANVLGNPPTEVGNNTEWESAARGDHDPFDVFRVDPAAFRLVPLIYSAGRDEELGLWDASGYAAWQGITNSNSSFNASNLQSLSPYQVATDPDDTASEYLGTAMEGTATDNVHNHLLGQR